MTLLELKAYRLALREKLDQLDRILPACHSCTHFATGRRCSKFNAEPPEAFQRTPESCPDWHYDQIPF